jgi:PD-(D/E)XK nuclease superfamily
MIPTKHEVIPIHGSDRGAFKSCRRRWDWSSPMRQNLVPRVSEHAPYMPLWFGSGVHWALKHYYDPALQRDPVEVFKTWYEVQWNGGRIHESWLDTVYDRAPVASNQLGEPFYVVRGLVDMLAQPELYIEEYEEHRELGINMLKYYKDYAEEFDDFDVISAEHTFSVPILLGDGSTMHAIDPRDGEVKPVHLRGTQDAIIQHRQSGKYGILEHKTAVSIGEDYFLKLDKDEQCTTYLYAAELEADVYDLPYKKVEFVLYNAVRKAFPRPPTITSRGDISIDRQKESTTYEMLMETIEDLGMSEHWQGNPKLSAYVDYVKDAGHEQFIVRNLVHRNRHEIHSCGERILMETVDMLGAPNIYPSPNGSWFCLRCPFRAPCIAKDDGSDWETMLDDTFEKNWTR